MNVLVMNGSPKGEGSNTLKLTHAFLKGMANVAPVSVNTLHVSAMDIAHCRGCFGCWTATPGRCVIRDDMESVLENMLHSDLLVWSFPLYYFGMPSKIKALMDRTLPLLQPFMHENADGTPTHPRRHPRHNPKVMLISTCGFFSVTGNYEALIKQFEIQYGERLEKILCPEGELFGRPELTQRTEEYLESVKLAGEEYARAGHIGAATKQMLQELLFPPHAFIQMANASWDIHEQAEEKAGDGADCKRKEDKLYSDTLRFTQQMAATYNPASYKGKKQVVEIHYTDANLACQLVLGDEECLVLTQPEIFLPEYTVRIETPYSVWKSISEGKITGPQAMMDGLYKTKGSLQFMMDWDKYFFGSAIGKNENPPVGAKAQKSSLLPLLLLWMPLWIFLPIHTLWGSVLSIAVAALLRFAALRWQRTIYDDISAVAVTGIALMALLGVDIHLLSPLSYLAFGMLWLGSCAAQIPLTAHYVKGAYGGDVALQNPLYIKTNRILTACWGVLYILAAGWSWLLAGGALAPYTGLINSVASLIMGGFTLWFQRWYPAKVAAGE